MNLLGYSLGSCQYAHDKALLDSELFATKQRK